MPLPETIIKDFEKFVPTLLKQRNEVIRNWMNNSINELKGTSTNIDDFVRKTN